MIYKSGELFLTLDKAVEVAVNQFDVDPFIARQEFEQKCYIPCSDYEKGFYDGLARSRDIIEESMSEGLTEKMDLIDLETHTQNIIPDGVVYCSPRTAEDVAIVTRCRKCRHAESDLEANNYTWCELFDMMVYANGYCYKGERRGEE